jgi:hypothetical protein
MSNFKKIQGGQKKFRGGGVPPLYYPYAHVCKQLLFLVPQILAYFKYQLHWYFKYQLVFQIGEIIVIPLPEALNAEGRWQNCRFFSVSSLSIQT